MTDGIKINEKIEVTALQLLYIISDAIDEFCAEHYDEDNCFMSLGFAKDKVVEIFEKHTEESSQEKTEIEKS